MLWHTFGNLPSGMKNARYWNSFRPGFIRCITELKVVRVICQSAKITILLAILGVSLPALALASGNQGSIFGTDVDSNGNVKPPEYLFSWVTSNTLDHLAGLSPGSNLMPLPLNTVYKGGLNLNTHFMYMWSHPTAAAMFAVERDPTAHPTLIVAKIKSTARTAVIDSGGPDTPGMHLNNFAQTDLILHQVVFVNEMQKTYHEWLLLDPDPTSAGPPAVEWFTADPRLIPQEIKDEMVESVKAGAQLKSDELFVNSENTSSVDTDERKQAVNEFLGMTGEELDRLIPPLFRQPLSGQIISKNCLEVMSSPKLAPLAIPPDPQNSTGPVK